MPQPIIFGLIAFAIVNGMFSPMLGVVLPAVLLFGPAFFAGSLPVLAFVSYLIMSTLTLMAGGIPAALYERFARAPDPAITGFIWLAGVAILTLPAVPNVTKALGLN
jgi:hypothetical protein